MNTREDLQRWDDFIAAQMLAFDAAYLVKAGEPHVADPLRVAFLQVSDSLYQANVERAIDDFLVNDAWPIWLSLDELVNITHRAHFARSMLKIMLGLQKGAPAVFVPAANFKIPCATDRPVFLRWLLVDTWRTFGQAWLASLAGSYLDVQDSARSAPPA